MGSKPEVTSVPKYGLKLKLNHEYPENWSQNRIPPWYQIWPILGMIIRYTIFFIKVVWQGRRPVMDSIRVQRSKQMYGVPIGGIGSGTIGRGYKGEFCRYQLRPGLYEYETVDANQFIVTIKDESEVTLFQSCLSTYEKKSKALKSWRSDLKPEKCNYTGLYPRAWTEYDLSEYGITLVCRQISPVLPNNYEDSCLPCAVFVWEVQNVGSKDLSVTIAFMLKNGIGVSKVDKESTSSSKPFSFLGSEGVILYHKIDKTNCTYAIGAKTRDDLNVSQCVHFDPNSDGKEPWNQLLTNGRFDKISDNRFDNVFGEMGVGVAVQVKVPPKGLKTIEYTLVWDMPVVTFFYAKKKHTKFYTRLFGLDGTLKMVNHSLERYPIWESTIHQWQKPILDNPVYPDWYKSALFNETYFVSDGGSVWFTLDKEESARLPDNDPRQTYGRFGYLEGHEYRMYNTYDVHFYASFALAMNWPKLQEIIHYDFRDSVFTENTDMMQELYNGNWCERKVKNTVPHDLGDPDEEAFLLINAYPSHDVSEWRDLNVKFVLGVFRDYKMRTDENRKRYLEDMYGAIKTVMVRTELMDTDGDGVIDNTGTPDQTFDGWVMTGASAYCGGLWLAALYAMTIFADALEKPDDKNKYSLLLEKAKKSFDRKLWNGKFYNFDMSETEHSVLMADQLCAQWYLRASGVKYEVFPQEKVLSALKQIFNFNVLGFRDGQLGAVNGINSDGTITVTSLQSEEMWTGVTYGIAASMIQEGMLEEAWKTAGGMYKTMTEKLGLAFETPEALYRDKYYRSIGYMRPLSIWSMQLALDAK